jgi:hypothetical protein
MASETELRRAYLKCVDFCRQITYHRLMTPYIGNLKNNYFICSFNNFIDLAVLDFCHLFGSRSDDLHWNNIVNAPDEFKNNLLKELKFTEDEWIKYWDSVKEYRDKDVAHLEIRPISNVPDMAIATIAIFFYYNSIIQELKKYKKYDMFLDDLSDYIGQLEGWTGKYIKEKISPLFDFVDAT